MTWARLDDNVLDHPKIMAVSPLAELLFYRCCVYINRQQTQGFVPAGAISQLARCSPKQALRRAAELVVVKLLHERPGGWEVHDWQDYARPPLDVDALREAGARGGLRSAEVRRVRYGSAQPPRPKALASKPPEAKASEASPKPLEARATGRDGEGLQDVLEGRPVEGGEPLDTRLIDRQFRVVAP